MAAVSKTWHLLEHDAAAIRRLANELNASPILVQLLLNRGVKDAPAARRFLAAPLTDLHEPERLPGIAEAVDRLLAAVRDKRPICVYGDYDVDGVTGAAIPLTCLKLLNANVDCHIPHRIEHGYGLHCDTLTQLAERGVRTVVTVDCGIASVREARHARDLGLELIVTDHHEPKGELPPAAVLVHPRLPVGSNGSTTHYPFGHLSGAGVAFKLAWALCKKHCGSPKVTPPLRDFLLDSVTLAALGTVADVVPLCDENRVFVRHGLAGLKQRPSPGLRALLKSARLDTKRELEAADIGYALAPRINAAGRVATARLAVELLTTRCAQTAASLAEQLESHNAERRELEHGILREARSLADADGAAPAFVLASASWHPGLLGIVASRLVDHYGRPALLIALQDGQPHGQGSGRSIPGFKLHQALEECTQDLVSHGGHAAAAGFRIAPEHIAPFRDRFCDVVLRQCGGAVPSPRLVLDAEIPLSALTTGLVQAIGRLEPFGAGNPQPMLLAGPVQVIGAPRRVGAGERHLAFRVRQEGREIRAIAFSMGERLEELMSQSGQCCLAFTPRWNEHQGQRWLEIEVRDFQAGPRARLS